MVDQQRVAAAVREILLAVGEDPNRDGLKTTPDRVARMYAEIFSGLGAHPESVLTTIFEADHDEMVLVKDIEVTSTCELLPSSAVSAGPPPLVGRWRILMSAAFMNSAVGRCSAP